MPINGVRTPVVNGHACPLRDNPEAYTTIRLRLLEAVDTLRRLPYPRDGAPRALRAYWPEIHDR